MQQPTPEPPKLTWPQYRRYQQFIENERQTLQNFLTGAITSYGNENVTITWIPYNEDITSIDVFFLDQGSWGKDILDLCKTVSPMLRKRVHLEAALYYDDEDQPREINVTSMQLVVG